MMKDMSWVSWSDKSLQTIIDILIVIFMTTDFYARLFFKIKIIWVYLHNFVNTDTIAKNLSSGFYLSNIITHTHTHTEHIFDKGVNWRLQNSLVLMKDAITFKIIVFIDTIYVR